MFSIRYGGKWVFGLGLLVTAIFTVLTPVAAEAGIGVLMTARILEGLGEGVALPAMHALVSQWFPVQERSRLASIVFAGTQAGSVVSLPLSGILADDVSWESVFYIFGGLGIAWFVAWAIFVFDTPAKHPRISPVKNSTLSSHHSPFFQSEREYIEANIPKLENVAKVPNPPLKHFFTSIPFLALIVVHFGQNFGFYTLLTETPTYLNNIQHYSLKEVSGETIEKSISTYHHRPFLSFPSYFRFVVFSERDLIRRALRLRLGLRHRRGVRLRCLGQEGHIVDDDHAQALKQRRTLRSSPGSGLAELRGVRSDAGHRRPQLIRGPQRSHLLGISGSLVSTHHLRHALLYYLHKINHVDLSPNYAGTLMGITNMVANINGFLAPYIIGKLTKDHVSLPASRSGKATCLSDASAREQSM